MRPFALAVSLLCVGCNVQETQLGFHDGGAGATPRPQVMWLIDKSGSMNFPANDQVAPCTPNCNASGNPACATGCKTRMQAMKEAVGAVVTDGGAFAWQGLAIFPTAVAGAGGFVDVCGPTTTADLRVKLAPSASELAGDVAATGAAVNAQVQALVAGGGTPTAGSLAFLAADPTLTGATRPSYVFLLTDGAPNCNANNANDCNTPTACRCTLVPSTTCTPASFCKQGCLDQDASVAEVAKLRTRGVKTVVIGFGAETVSGDAFESLTAMAEAGGMQRACPNGTDAECGTGNTCSGQVCSRKYYQAASAEELAAALRQILQRL